MPYNRFSREESAKKLFQVSGSFFRGQWLYGNRYRDNCIKKIKDDCRGRSIVKLSLKKYIAASAPLHCADGWSFLGKAVLSGSLGDNNAAMHFAYYAELRAAMSLLASEGIGIFNGKDFTMDKVDLHGPYSHGGTHLATDKAFHQWADSLNSSSLLEDIIRPAGIPIKDWLSEITTSTSGAPISWAAKDWLSQWGYDLLTLPLDQIMRNEASYRPTGFKPLPAVEIRYIKEIIMNIWDLLEQVKPQSYFIDLLLLKKVLDNYALGVRKTFSKNDIEGIVTRLGFSQGEIVSLTKLLSGDIRKITGYNLLAWASEERDDYKYHLFMISRATFLLRVATGACARMITKAKINKEDIRFWWMPLGVKLGLWKSTEMDPFNFMRDDIAQALKNLRNVNVTSMQMAEWSSLYSKELLTLSGCERLALEGICL